VSVPEVKPPENFEFGDQIISPAAGSRVNTAHIGTLQPPNDSSGYHYETPALCSEYINQRTGEPIKNGVRRIALYRVGYGMPPRSKFDPTLLIANEDGTGAEYQYPGTNPQFHGVTVCAWCWKQYNIVNAPDVPDEAVDALVNGVSTPAGSDRVINAARGLKPTQIAAARRLMVTRLAQLKNAIQSQYNEFLTLEKERIDKDYADTSKLESARQLATQFRDRIEQEWRQLEEEQLKLGVRPSGKQQGYSSSRVSVSVPSDWESTGKAEATKKMIDDAESAKAAALLALEKTQLLFEEKLLIAQLSGSAAEDLLSVIPSAEDLFTKALGNQAQMKELQNS